MMDPAGLEVLTDADRCREAMQACHSAQQRHVRDKLIAVVITEFSRHLEHARAKGVDSASTPSEAVEIGKAIEEMERPKAAERRREHGGTSPGKPADNTSGNLPEVSGDTRDKVAEALGMSGKTYEKAKAESRAEYADNAPAPADDPLAVETITPGSSPAEFLRRERERFRSWHASKVQARDDAAAGPAAAAHDPSHDETNPISPPPI